LEQREVVTRRSAGELAGEPAFGFRHSLVRDAAYAMLTEEDRSLGHRLAADHLARAGVHDAVMLAEHFERGNLPEEALRWWRESASDALAANDFEGALQRAERGAKFAVDPSDRAALELARAEALRLSGNAVDAAEAVSAAVASAPEGSLVWCNAVGERALVLQRLGRAHELGETTLALGRVRAEVGAEEAWALARARAGLALLRVGMRSEALELMAPLETTEAMLGPLTAAYVHAFRAVGALLEGNPSRYLAEAMSAAAHHQTIGDERAALEQRINIGSVYIELGAFERAAELLSEALHSAERMGLPHAVAGAKHNLGLALAHLGRFDDAVALETQARDAFREADRRLEGGAELCLAMIQRLAGDPAKTLLHAARALELLNAAAPPLAPAARATLAIAQLELGDLARARELAASAYSDLARPGRVEYGEHLIRYAHAEVSARAGDAGLARAVATEGRARLRALAAKMSDPSLAQTLLERVPENRALIALADSLDEPV
jgi:tetratricopeptide (TPR) repeat protein